MNTFPQLQTFNGLALTADYTEGSCSSAMVTFENFLLFNFPFSKVQTINSSFSSFFLDNYSSIFDVVTRKSWVCHQLNAFKIPRMVYYKQISPMISFNDANYTIHKLIRILLILIQILVKLFVSNRLIFTLYNLNKSDLFPSTNCRMRIFSYRLNENGKFLEIFYVS